MDAERRRRTVVIAAVALALIVLAAALTLAGSAGFLPWQPEPTRIPITPFADLPQSSLGTPTP